MTICDGGSMRARMAWHESRLLLPMVRRQPDDVMPLLGALCSMQHQQYMSSSSFFSLHIHHITSQDLSGFCSCHLWCVLSLTLLNFLDTTKIQSIYKSGRFQQLDGNHFLILQLKIEYQTFVIVQGIHVEHKNLPRTCHNKVHGNAFHHQNSTRNWFSQGQFITERQESTTRPIYRKKANIYEAQ